MAIKSNEFAVVVTDILDDFAEDIQEAVAQAVEQTGKQALKTVRAKSPVRKGKGGGRYKKGWRMKKNRSGIFKTQSSITIYNAKGGSITHVVEKGYQKASGGRVAGQPHIQPAFEEAEHLLPELAAQAIEEVGKK